MFGMFCRFVAVVLATLVVFLLGVVFLVELLHLRDLYSRTVLSVLWGVVSGLSVSAVAGDWVRGDA